MPSKNSIRKKAEQLHRDYNLTFPVDLSWLTEELGFDVSYLRLEDEVSGMLVSGGRGAAIGINKGHAPVRQRFTLAHEIGHYLLHTTPGEEVEFVDKVRYRRSLKETPLKPEPEEVEANLFAAELLMPRFEVERLIQRNEVEFFKDEMVEAFAKYFGVSVQAMMVRLSNLGYIPDWGML